MQAIVAAVAVSPAHGFSKPVHPSIRLVAGWGVAGDAHSGALVKHRSRVAKNPAQPNLRQVHLIHAELLDALDLEPGAVGENVALRGVDLLGLPEGALLGLGETAVVRVTGLRNPCRQLDKYRPGLMASMLGRDADGGLVRKAGVMAVVVTGGDVRPGDAVRVTLPEGEHRRLMPV
ncbi:MOSC domain-containing protein [Plastoroseomonas arctica]|uniref:MOSC domain-containing protein n=1 Tax=Plastoroseomonas arctica TaxID=1509237 RepID=A0AAF1KHS1_9PROT|nr:MOSC domain-containing protein [Plastoroseomonas arctica]MBR0653745.1 MOSC domain-containing protein [Plastoroseomonas arctica]